MRRIVCSISLTLMLAGNLPAQLKPEQKLADFQALVALYAKNYAPYEWKRDAIKFDLMDIGGWLARVAATPDDLSFYDVCVDYVASLRDGHDQFYTPSTFSASLGFNVDIYDGKVLVDSITRSRLPLATYPFQIGDELVSVDGKTAEELIAAFSNSTMYANPNSTRRTAAGRIVSRPQSRLPRAIEVGDSATVVLRRQSGTLDSYTIPWVKSGLPLTVVGPVPNPKPAPRAATSLDGDPLERLHNERDSNTEAVLGYGSVTSILTRPAGYSARTSPAGFFASGTFPLEGKTIGMIRIPTFAPASFNSTVTAFGAEIAYMQANTDALVIDVMRNTGGDPCFRDALMAYLIPAPFQTMTYEIRATWNELLSFSNSLQQAQLTGPPEAVQQYQALVDALQEAYRSERGLTRPIPVCSPSTTLTPATDRAGNIAAYTKPILLLTDWFSVSAAEGFAAVFQDNARGPILGTRTGGMGGSVVNYDTAAYSEGYTRVTVSLMSRPKATITSDYPAAPYVENIGVRPDVEVEYMTKSNLLSGGKDFTGAMTAALVNLLK